MKNKINIKIFSKLVVISMLISVALFVQSGSAMKTESNDCGCNKETTTNELEIIDEEIIEIEGGVITKATLEDGKTAYLGFIDNEITKTKTLSTLFNNKGKTYSSNDDMWECIGTCIDYYIRSDWFISLFCGWWCEPCITELSLPHCIWCGACAGGTALGCILLCYFTNGRWEPTPP